MKTTLFSLTISLLLIGGQPARCQAIDWAKTKNWQLYFPDTGRLFTVASLKGRGSIALNDDSIHSCLKDATIYPPGEQSVWMGIFLCSTELPDKTTICVLFSWYGGFFWNAQQNRLYQLPKDEFESLKEYLQLMLAKIQEAK